MKRYLFTTAMCTLAFLMAGPNVHAQVCEEPSVQSELQYLRRLSLDLRGYLPTYDEYQRVIDDGEVVGGTVEDMLASDGFAHQTRAYHLELLWTSLGTQRLANNTFKLATGRGRNTGAPLASIANARRAIYRGGAVSCRNEPAEFDADGNILAIEEEFPAGSGNIVRREGYVDVEPYWAPGTTVRVCAYDAQENEFGTNPQGRPVPCRQAVAPDCGCGPNLRSCFTGQTEQNVLRAMVEQTLEFLVRTVTEDHPYTDVITGHGFRVNGPLVHYYKYQSSAAPNFVAASTDPGFDLPDLAFTDTAWVPVSGVKYGHSGVLTLPGFLLKFQSNRARANRFYEAFLCKSFVAPEGGLPASTDPCNEEPDLAKRCGCEFCHQAVEPAASHWGRWSEAGVAPLPSSSFPRYNENCDPNESRQAGRNGVCRRFYNTDDESPYSGQLSVYEFADDHPEREEIIEAGPSRIAQAAIDSGELAQCTVSKLWQKLLDRPVSEADTESISTLIETFNDGYSMATVIHAIVTSPEYRYAGLMGQEEE